MLIYGHRGAPATFPENTLPSFEAAIHAGVDGLEFDVRASADGVPVVLHDQDLARTTSGAGNVDELSLATIRQLDAGNGETVPKLEEVLDLVADLVHLDIEVKQSGIESIVLATLARFPRARWTLSSFDPEILIAFRAISQTVHLIPIAALANPPLVEFARSINAPAVALLSTAYDESSSRIFAGGSLPVIVWTVNDIFEAERVQQLGAHGLCTDCPADIIAGLASRPDALNTLPGASRI
ncbi:MAG: glycerophosphodiester phosphodiesterase [Thermomicrobiales bacterium]